MVETMTSMQRVLTTLSHKEPDRVPLFLMLTMHGAQELNMSIKDYFFDAESVVEGQMLMREKYQHDCLYPFFYAPIELEAWGAEVIFSSDGPPNSGQPFIQRPEEINSLNSPNAAQSPALSRVYDTISHLKKRVGDTVPIIGVVMSPFSVPVMQMGFDNYLDLIYERPDLFNKLMRINEEFCVTYANIQLASGATAICYFDPVSSPTIVPRHIYQATGHEIARRTIARIKGPVATHLASGRSLGIIGDLSSTGTVVVGASVDDDLTQLKHVCQGKMSILGNLNGIAMRNWSARQADDAVKETIAKAGRGGGFILSDNHGEIPWQVPEHVLTNISESVRRWGRYPLEWVETNEK